MNTVYASHQSKIPYDRLTTLKTKELPDAMQ